MTRRTKNILSAGLALAMAAANVFAQSAPTMGSLPLCFEAQGQSDGRARYLARGRDCEVSIAPTEARLTLRGGASIAEQFIGASPDAQIQGEAPLAGKINYLSGNNPAQWRTGVPTFSRVGIENLYPGVKAVYYGNEQRLEYDFNLAAGTSPSVIALHFTGVDGLSVNERGELVLNVQPGGIYQPKPVIYQVSAGVRREIAGGYKMLDARTVGFAVGDYDHRLPLIIDPILSYSSYFGGTSGQAALGIAIDKSDGSIFIAGQTLSGQAGTNGAPFTATGYQKTFQGGTVYGDAFVAKFDRQGTNLIYLTYLGGASEDVADAIAVDNAGDAFVAGYTDSRNFPITTVTNPIPGVATNIQGAPIAGYYPWDAFVTELDPTGSHLIYSTLLGGSLSDCAFGLAIDGSDNAYVTGYTASTNFPVAHPIPFTLTGTTNHFLNRLACTNTINANCNAFITKINAGGASLGYSSYFGGNSFDIGTSIAVDSAGNVYVTGYTSSTNFPNTNAFQAYLNRSTNLTFNLDAFVAKFDATGTNLLYSTYLGNTNDDAGYSIAVDSQEAAYVTGWTTSTNFYNTNSTGKLIIRNGVTNNVNGTIYTTNVFLTKITNNINDSTIGNRAGIAYSVVFGGDLSDVGYGVAVDPYGNAFVTGTTSSQFLFPTNNTLGLLRDTNSGRDDIFVTAFNAAGTQVLYSGYLGGYNNDYGYAIAVDADSSAYVVGQTYSLRGFPITTVSTNFPIYSAMQPALNGSDDCFLAKILITQFTLAPSISAVKSNKVTIAWPEYAEFEPDLSGLVLQSSTNLATNAWVTLTNTSVLTNNWHVTTVPATNHYQFFRLNN